MKAVLGSVLSELISSSSPSHRSASNDVQSRRSAFGRRGGEWGGGRGGGEEKDEESRQQRPDSSVTPPCDDCDRDVSLIGIEGTLFPNWQVQHVEFHTCISHVAAELPTFPSPRSGFFHFHSLQVFQLSFLFQ